MIVARSFAHIAIGVFGPRDGAAAASLREGDARVHLLDRAAPDLAGLAALVVAPDTPAILIEDAQALGIEIVSEIELFAREIGADPAVPGRAPVIAVAGEPAVASLAAHILAASGFEAQAGSPLLFDPPNARTIYVLDLALGEIARAPSLVPDVAVGNDASLLKQASKAGQVVIGVDDAQGASLYTRHAANGGPTAVPVSAGKVLGRGIFVVDGTLYDAQGQRAARVMELADGDPRRAALAYAATRPFARDGRAIARAMADLRPSLREAS